jgi:hypothetical protein
MATSSLLAGLTRRLRPYVLPLAIVSGCSLAVDTSDIDAGCGEAERLCAKRCVSVTDPDYGCNPNSCGPACRPANAQPVCQAGQCQPLRCQEGFAQCEGQNGCETRIFVDRQNCGVCGKRCSAPELCKAGICRLATEEPED